MEHTTELATECQRLGGTWYDTIWQDTNTDAKHDTQNHWLHKKFYDDTAANTDWGYCGTDDEIYADTNIKTEEEEEEEETPKQCAQVSDTNCYIPDVNDETTCTQKYGA